ncbi:TetR/AcrR family transcriptional regulator [Actinosynnema sp. NPDC047251]|uniref:Transcriptional regulator, TetR family n=1 Tax=Saccharothrix espanaensis (strain ATCC 51144 / DSM 44229 / JCM 9112 / NBRC 15066 / NRRL 15764) TaxID=1179773 RepID=K0K433_SACES|nr:TetR/AcrR family transcriptional regulator [Saccharothrix espanaensis]CCH35015.1 Transcriptional regulator, TetR family [Saccharothrix espanaensis DSM 44229]
MTTTRRERYREETRDEAKRIALEQLAELGVDGVSVNAIAKRMGVTGPALYRYFKNRVDLLNELIRDAWRDLAEAVEASVRRTAGHPPRERVHGFGQAFRDWAIGQPHRYLLLFGSPVPGYHAPHDTIALAHRTMSAFIGVLTEAHADPSARPAEPPADPSAVPPAGASAMPAAGASAAPVAEPPAGPSAVPVAEPSGLDGQLVAWARSRGEGEVDPAVLLTALRAFTRLHGVLSLEVSGQFGPMGFDPALLYRAEVDSLLRGD